MSGWASEQGGTTGTVTKASVGLGNVDNTADLSKPVSVLQAAAAVAAKDVGKMGGRIITGQIDGTDATNGAVSTALTSYAMTTLPMAHSVQAQGVSLDTANSIRILTDGLYRVSGNVRYSGGNATAFFHDTAIQVNGQSVVESGLVYTGSSTGNGSAYRELMLSAGDVVTLCSYVESGSVVTQARVANVSDVNLTVTRCLPTPVQPILSGWSGIASATSAASYGSATRDITNHWLSKNTWSDLTGASFSTDALYWKTNFQSRAITVGCPIIPHKGNAASTWNTLLDQVIAGTQDATFTALGTNLALNGPNTVICRLWWEMNVDLNNNAGMIDATKFANAWNHVAPIIRAAFNAAARSGQVIKFSYSYLIYLSPGSTYNEMTLYPGDTNVDVIAPDAYFQLYGTTNPTQAAALTAMKGRLQEAGIYAAKHNKPLGIDEWGTHILMAADGTNQVRGLGDAPAVVDCMYDWAEQNQISHMSCYSVTDSAGFLSIDNYPNFLARFISRGNAVATFATAR